MQSRRLSPCLTALALLLAGEALYAAQPTSEPTTHHGAGDPEASYHGGLVTPPLPKPSFTLTDTSGSPFDFRSQTDGHVTLLFFGFTHCTDVCPMQMTYLASALHRLPREVADHLKVVFVTTDPDRDNPRLLRTWLNRFDRNFVGLTGSKDDIQAAQAAANVPVAHGSPGYGHASFVLVYTSDNQAHVIYPAGVTQADWIEDLPRLAKETWPGH